MVPLEHHADKNMSESKALEEAPLDHVKELTVDEMVDDLLVPLEHYADKNMRESKALEEAPLDQVNPNHNCTASSV